MIDQYIARVNNDHYLFDLETMDSSKDKRSVSTSLNTEYEGYHYKLARGQGDITVTQDGATTTFKVPYKAWSTEGMVSSTSSLEG